MITTDDLKPGHPAHTVPLPAVDLGSPWITSWITGTSSDFRKRLRLIIGWWLINITIPFIREFLWVHKPTTAGGSTLSPKGTDVAIVQFWDEYLWAVVRYIIAPPV